MVPLRCLLAVTYVLSVWTTGYTKRCGEGQAHVGEICCDRCPPGEKVKEFCTERMKTVCVPCVEGKFSDKYSIFDRCNECRSCHGKDKKEYAENCTRTTDAKCSCHSGFLCSDNVCSTCVENKCVAGERPIQTVSTGGKYLYDCKPACPAHEYLDVKMDICKPRIQCSALGLAELFPGNKTHNSVCDVYATGGDSIRVILSIGFVLLSLSLVLFLSSVCIKNLRKHRTKNNPVLAVSANTCDFHLSKEESGLQLIIQDENKDSNGFSNLHPGSTL
ncbi:tumor necrosis factor receptor superfamily member 5 isoform X2 [Lates calcarifer]|uniref:Tumor necrosis factor receptor superfamily member 5 isoform X2 n=1 Tax=Lates calcarifer TaxID=8187 RepID=A0AAJ7PZ44_LATCA|nr:tumor necrosis factor receptor superfamily member 5 isoform X2 [Lates calcarifer]